MVHDRYVEHKRQNITKGGLRRQTMKRKIAVILLLCTFFMMGVSVWQDASLEAARRRTLFWGSRGSDVITMQKRLKAWGYYKGSVDGIYGGSTFSAVRSFQRKNGLRADGVVGSRTWSALGLGTGTTAPAKTVAKGVRGVTNKNDLHMIARLIHAEARAEPYIGQVSVGAVLLNRVRSAKFPDSVAGVIYQPLAFESVANGQFNLPPTTENYKAAQDSLNGWDPTYGCTFFWNPAKRVSKWIWSRKIIVRYGGHVFGR